jgi:hypothetical protein
MPTTETTQAAALASPGGYTIRAEFTASGAYSIELTKAAAKAICAEWLDPDEPWADQAEHTLETALEGFVEDLFNERQGNHRMASWCADLARGYQQRLARLGGQAGG